MKRQVAEAAKDIPNKSFQSQNAAIIQALLCVGTFPNVGLKLPGATNVRSGREKAIRTHASSCIKKLQKNSKHEWMVFEGLLRTLGG